MTIQDYSSELSDDPFPTSSGEQLRDFYYVDDVAQGIRLHTITSILVKKFKLSIRLK